ncbi:MAG: hypothetical protein LUG96_01235 [Tannerellaceae bacterium]|nr:hypothetical protein [Tannerellaceae bacterium]
MKGNIEHDVDIDDNRRRSDMKNNADRLDDKWEEGKDKVRTGTRELGDKIEDGTDRVKEGTKRTGEKIGNETKKVEREVNRRLND